MNEKENQSVPGAVQYEVSDHIATITLDNPKARNAFDLEMSQELKRIWNEIARDPEIRCAIVTGEGDRAFCTGWDISSTEICQSRSEGRPLQLDHRGSE